MRHRVVGLDLVQLLARDGPEDLVEALLRRGRLAHFAIVDLDLHEDRDVVARRLELVDGVQVERDLAPADLVFQFFEREERARVERGLDLCTNQSWSGSEHLNHALIFTSHMAWAPGHTTVARRASRTSALTGCHPAPSSARCFLAISDFMASTMRSAVLMEPSSLATTTAPSTRPATSSSAAFSAGLCANQPVMRVRS